MKIKVIAFEHLFISGDFKSAWDEDAVFKNGIKYLPLETIREVGLLYAEEDIQEIEI